MSARVLLVGASGLAREVLAAGLAGAAGILDDDAALHGTEVSGVPVLGAIAEAARRPGQLLVCVGSGIRRRAIVRRLAEAGIGDDRFARFVAGSARVGRSSGIGAGSIVLDGVVATADVRVGRHVVVMPNCTLTHDDRVGDFATLAAGVALGGSVRVGEAAYLGMNSSVRERVAVGTAATVGMGAVVLDDVPAAETWAGVPARPIGVRA